MECEGYDASDDHKLYNKVTDLLLADRVIVKRLPSVTDDEKVLMVLMVNKWNQSDRVAVSGCYNSMDWCKDRSPYCTDQPEFISQMNESLFKTIEGVVDYSFGTQSESGHLLLLNINGRPKMCFTPENEDISEEVCYL